MKSELVVLVTGGRDYEDFAYVSSVLSNLKPIYIIHGGATGADSLAQKWADSNNVITYVKKSRLD
jgi:hypothetical protein